MNNLRQIYEAFEGKLVGSRVLKKNVCQVLALMEEDIILYITKNCWFFGSTEDAWAFTLTGNDLRDQHLVIIGDELLMQSQGQIHYTIAHEIGHVMLGHSNSMLRRQTKVEIRRQEKAADQFAKRYIS